MGADRAASVAAAAADPSLGFRLPSEVPFRRYDLQNSDVSRADFTEANLEKADLRQARLEGARLEGANTAKTLGVERSEEAGFGPYRT